MDHTNWDFNEFLAFLLIYASYADLEFTEDEKKQIQETVSPEVFDEIYAHFETLTDYQALELILSYRDVYFSNEEDKSVIFDELKKLFTVDGEFSALEKELLQFSDKLM